LEYQDPIPPDQTVAQLPLEMVQPAAPEEVDLIDVALILIVAFLAMVVGTLVTIAGYMLAHRQHTFDPRLLSENVMVVLPAQLVAYLIVVGFMAFIVAARHNRTLAEAIHWNSPSGKRWLQALGGGAAMGFGSQLASAFLSRWIPKSLPIDQYFRDTSSAYLLAGFGIFIAPFVEEVFFRGFVFPALARWTGPAISVIITAGAFAMLHQGQLAHAWAPLLILFVVGTVLTIVRARTNSVSTCVLVHMGYNGALFGMLFFATQGFRHLEKAF
jgi:membrane protease YdiL (CAAX protease family)